MAEKVKKKARKAQFFEVMGDTLDKITQARYTVENQNRHTLTNNEIQERKQ